MDTPSFFDEITRIFNNINDLFNAELKNVTYTDGPTSEFVNMNPKVQATINIYQDEFKEIKDLFDQMPGNPQAAKEWLKKIKSLIESSKRLFMAVKALDAALEVETDESVEEKVEDNENHFRMRYIRYSNSNSKVYGGTRFLRSKKDSLRQRKQAPNEKWTEDERLNKRMK